MMFVQLPSHLPRTLDDHSEPVITSVVKEEASSSSSSSSRGAGGHRVQVARIPTQPSNSESSDSPIVNDISDLSSGNIE